MVLAVIILSWFAWQRRKQQKAAQEAAKADQAAIEKARLVPLPEGSLEIAINGPIPKALQASKMLLLLVGTFAASLGLRILQMLAMCGLTDEPGSILLIEPDVKRRDEFLNGTEEAEGIPDVFRDRLVVVECASLSGGGANRDRDWLKGQQQVWVPEVQAKSREACDLHRRRNLQLYGESVDAAQVLDVFSEGTTGFMGPEALKVILGHFPAAQCVGLTAYPVDYRLRSRVRDLLNEHVMAGCHGVFAGDNAPDEECPDRDLLANDLGSVGLVVAPISAAAHNHDAVTEGNNMYTLILPKEKGGLASFRVVVSSIPGAAFQPHPKLDARYYVTGQTMTATVLSTLKEVENPKYRAASAEFGLPDTSRFDIILTALEPKSLGALEDSVLTALKASASPPPSHNYHLLFASIKTAINPRKPTCSIICLSVEAINNKEDHLQKVASLPPLIAPFVQAQLPPSKDELSVDKSSEAEKNQEVDDAAA